jgi:Circularly permutated YpsA SLOG family
MHLQTTTDVLRRVVSGGQTGADRGGLDAALEVGLEIGGRAPSRFRAADGVIPERYRLHMTAIDECSYAARTRLNVEESDATLVVSFAGWDRLSPGTAMTVREAQRAKKPCRHAWLPGGRFPGADRFAGVAEQLAEWVLGNRVATLNVAGPRESKEPGIQLATRQVVAEVLDLLMGERALLARAAFVEASS